MQFSFPIAFWLLWLLPALVGFGVWAHRRRQRAVEAFAAASLLGELMPEVSRGRQAIKLGLRILVLTLLILAAAGPRWGFQWEDIERKGVDIVLAVDLSRSMLAQDIQPSRLERARREIRDLMDMMQGDRVGLVAFAGMAYVQVPLTLDYGAFEVFLDALDTDLVPMQGTDLGAAIDAAIKAFDPEARSSKAVILITDGEDNEGQGLAAAERAKEQEIRIFTVGVGAEGGAPIPEVEGGGFKKDRHGQMILSHLDEAGLQKIALVTGGAYVRSVSGDMDLEEIYLQDIRQRMEARTLSSTRQKRWEERFQWPLGVAALLLLMENLLSDRRRRPVIAPSLMGFLAMILLWSGPTVAAAAEGAPFTGSSLKKGWTSWQEGEEARKGGKEEAGGFFQKALEGFLGAQVEKPLDPRLDYNVGAAQYRVGNYEEAAKAYEKAARDPSLAHASLYNLGNARFQQGALEEAIQAYEQALTKKPNDPDTLHNLEYTREELRKRLEEAKKTAQQQQKQQQKQDPANSPPPQEGESPQQKPDPNAPPPKEGEQEQQPRQGRPEGQEESPASPDDKTLDAEGQAKEEPDPNAPEGQESELSEEEAQRLLDSLKEDRRRPQQGNPRQRSRGKDW